MLSNYKNHHSEREDFAEFLNEVPGAMFRLGVSNEQGCAPLHSSTFNQMKEQLLLE